MSLVPKNNPGEGARYTSMSIKMAVVVAGGAIGGIYLDRFIGWKFPLFTLLLTLASVALAIYILILETKR